MNDVTAYVFNMHTVYRAFDFYLLGLKTMLHGGVTYIFILQIHVQEVAELH